MRRKHRGMPAGPLLLVVLALALLGCGRQAGGPPPTAAMLTPPADLAGTAPATLRVFAAASLSGVFEELADQFEAANPGVRVELNFAGSQQLAHQINEGAPADVFASANERQMEVVVRGGRVAEDAPRIFAGSQLVIATPGGNPGNIRVLNDLARPGIKLVLAAEEVPAGQYTREMLTKAGQEAQLGSAFVQALEKNVISYEDNIRAVLSRVSLGEADAGIVYTSDLKAAGMGSLGRVDIPRELNVRIVYPAAALRDSPNPVLAQAFVDSLLSPQGQDILGRYGFLAVQ